MTEAISSALNFMETPLLQPLAKLLDPHRERTVVDGIADPNHDPAQERRIDPGLEDGLERKRFGQPVADAALPPGNRVGGPTSTCTRRRPCRISLRIRASRKIAGKRSRRPCRASTRRKFVTISEARGAMTRSISRIFSSRPMTSESKISGDREL